MIKYVLLILSIVWAINSSAQTIYFNNLYGKTSRAEASFGITSIDSNYFITGLSIPAHSIIPRSELTICINQKGYTIWTRQDSTNNPIGGDIGQLNNDAIYEIGNADFPYNQTFCLKKLKPNGDSVWTKYYQFRLLDFGQSIIPTRDFGLLIVGTLNSDSTDTYYDAYNDKVCLIKTDSNGNIQWVDSLLEDTTGSYAVKGIENDDHSFTITGWYGLDALVFKVDSVGNLLWYKTFNSAYNEEVGASIVNVPDKGYLIGGYISEGEVDFVEYYSYLLLKIDSDGNLQWQKTYGDSLAAWGFRQIAKTLDGNYILIGSSQNYLGDTVFANLFKMDTAGNVLFERNYYKIPYPSDNWDGLTYDVLATPDSGYIFVGSNTDTTQHVWVVKTDKYGCDSVGCQNATGIAPIKIQSSSFNIYPNPAITQATVLYTVPENIQQVNLFVYDITGRRVEQQKLDKYSHQTTIDVSTLAAGLYLVELKTDDGNMVKKLVVE